jgi:Arc/MetJ family transcription regulator
MTPASARHFVIFATVLSLAVVSAATDRPRPPATPLYSTGVTGRTNLSGGTGCAGCHGASADATINVSITGPSALFPGQRGTYNVAVARASAEGSKVGIDVAASDAGSLSVVPGEPTAPSGNEITHSAAVGALRTISSGSTSYSFYYTMPASAAVSSAHTLAVVSAVSFLGWRHASNATVMAAAPPTPTSISTMAIAATSINLVWSGTTPEFRVIRKNGAAATFTGPTDGASTLVYEGPNTAVTATGLTASTAYTFAVYGKVSGASTYSTGNQTVSATTTTGSMSAALYYVNPAGIDTNPGTAASPFKTIKKAIAVALAGDTINVAAGTYNSAGGETFPITMPSGVQLMGSGATTTIINATGSGQRVINCSGNSASTRISGFTITGGLTIAAINGVSFGGGIYTLNSDQTIISQNIITNNESRGYAGQAPNSPSGGNAYGGGIYVQSSSTRIENNIISNNRAVGGAGVSNFGSSTQGGSGGGAFGGGIYGATNSHNNTIVGNSATGGAGGFSLGPGGAGGYGAGGGASLGTYTNDIFANNSAAGGTGGGSSPSGSNGGSGAGGLDSGSTAVNCLYFNNASGDGTTGTNPVTADPLFVDAANGNFHIQFASPAKGAGTPTAAPAIDMDGATRPNPPSIGAFEVPKSDTTIALNSSQNPSVLNQSVTFTATVASLGAGTITGTVTFKDGGTTIGTGTVGGGTASFITSSLTQGTHSITGVYGGDPAFNGSTSPVLSQTVNLPQFGAPQGLLATAVTNSQVSISWTAVANATGYELYRGTSINGVFGLVITTANTSFGDSGLSSSTTYLYKVRALSNGGPSAYSSIDAATTLIFTDDPVTGSTVARAVHISELRTAVNAMRTAAGLGTQTFTDALLTATAIRAVHITELRSALDAARAILGLSAINYIDPTITAGVTTLKTAHIQDLRDGVK